MDEAVARTRTERDTFGPVEVPAERLWGAQTQRSLEHFRISGERMPLALVHALVPRQEGGRPRPRRARRARGGERRGHRGRGGRGAGGRVGRRVPAGGVADRQRHPDEHERQRGAGEPRERDPRRGAGREAPRPPERRRQPRPVHERRLPHRDPRGRRSRRCGARSIPAVARLRDTLAAKAEAFRDVVKIGRTHLMDATPLTLGQEISGWAAQLDHGVAHLEQALPDLLELALGGTAVGTGLERPPRARGVRATARLAEPDGPPVRDRARTSSRRLRGGTPSSSPTPRCRTVAGSLFKIANDVRFLASGPRWGSARSRSPRTSPAARSCRAR